MHQVRMHPRHRVLGSPRRVGLALTLAAALAGGGIAGIALANPHGNISSRVEGTVTNGPGSFDGSLVVESIALQGGGLVARGTLDGTFTGADGKSSEMEPRGVTLPLDRAALAATCDQAHVRLQGTEVENRGARARLQPVELEIAAGAAKGPHLRETLCELSRLLGTSASDATLAKQLALVLDALQ
jgi:hypothetical protein